jgi:hypothetical protein
MQPHAHNRDDESVIVWFLIHGSREAPPLEWSSDTTPLLLAAQTAAAAEHVQEEQHACDNVEDD